MCDEEVGGDASLSGEFDLMLILNIWNPFGNEKRRSAACTAICMHKTELDCGGSKIYGKGL